MSSVTTVFQAIDAIEQLKFIWGDRINVDTGNSEKIFLRQLQIFMRGNFFESDIQKDPVTDIATLKILRLVKTPITCTDIDVSPQFINMLKTSTVALFSFLGADWEKPDNFSDDEDKSKIIFMQKTFYDFLVATLSFETYSQNSQLRKQNRVLLYIRIRMQSYRKRKAFRPIF